MSVGAVARARAIAEALPPGGLFHEKTWRISPDPFPLDGALLARLEKLGHQLEKFVQACAQLYRMSADGRQPGWVADLLDRGKPRELVELQRAKPFHSEVARIIRPDLILTDAGFTIAELDNVPGGIGLTAWLSEAYARQGTSVLGGADGMLDGFASIFPQGDILISEESATYRPEMEWLVRALQERHPQAGPWRVRDPKGSADQTAKIYRFFELFDLPNISGAETILHKVRLGSAEITPPLKPALEEKLWFALFWLKPLEPFWIRALGERSLRALREVIPYTWLVDPTPLPPHAVLPLLGVHDWDEVAKYSQKQRDLILKISGFSSTAWGSRGVILGSDMSGPDWEKALSQALDSWETSPHILQKFHHGRIVEHTFLEPESGHLTAVRGRVRLCPYYFLAPGKKVSLGGALATICPADKKLLHGMSDAILVPASVPSG